MSIDTFGIQLAKKRNFNVYLHERNRRDFEPAKTPVKTEENLPYLKSFDLTIPKFGSLDYFQHIPVVRFFIGQKCLLKCCYCFSKATTTATLFDKKIDYAFQPTIRAFKKWGMKTILINGKGEPMMHPDFDLLIKYNHKMGLRTVLFTTGLMLDEKRADFYFNHNVDLVLKLPSLNQEEVKKITGSYVLPQFLKKIDLCLNKGFHTDNRLGIDCPLTKTNEEDVVEVFKFARERNIIPFIEPLVIAGRATESMQPTRSQIRSVGEKMLQIDQHYGYHWNPKERGVFTAAPMELNQGFFQFGLNGTLHFYYNGSGYRLNKARIPRENKMPAVEPHKKDARQVIKKLQTNTWDRIKIAIEDRYFGRFHQYQ